MTEESRLEIQPQEHALPVQPGERIVFVDILRGFAMLGILMANMASFSGHANDLLAPLTAIDRWVLILIRFFITAKFYSLFSFLFGWGLTVQMGRARERGTGFTSLYLRRLFILLLIGILHGILIWSGEILTLYALFGFLLFLTRNRSDRTILIFMVLCLLLTILLRAPWKVPVEIVSRYDDLTAFMRMGQAPADIYSTGSYLDITRLRIKEYLGVLANFLFYFGNVFSMFLLGLWVGKRKIFQDIDQHLPWVYKVVVGGFIVGVLGNALNVWLILHPGEIPVAWIPSSYHQMVERIAYTFGAPALMLFYVSGMLLLLRHKYWQSILSPLANVGRMALSNYLFQSIIATLIFYNYGLGLYGEISPFVGLMVTVFIFLIQIRVSAWWFERYPYGPVEWIWRFLTYGRSPQSLTEVTGTPGIKIDRINRIGLFFKRLHPTWILSITWITLLVWAGLLITWNQQIGIARRASALLSGVVETTSPDNTIIQPVAEGQDGEIGLSDDQVHTFQQTPYPPGNIATSSDVEALAGAFDLQQALSEIATLTGAPYWGRQAGSLQGWAAGDYLASQFSRHGLQPLGDQGTYFQEFPVLYTPLEDTPRLYMESSFDTASEEFTAYVDFAPVVRWYAGSGSGKGQLYWMNRCAKGDFAAKDVVDMVLLCLPSSTPGWLQELSRRSLEHGAAALLFLTDPETRPADLGWSFKDVWVPQPVPVFFVYPELVTRLLNGSGRTIADLLANTKPFPLESMVGFEIKTLQSNACPGTNCLARNVIGILPGRDPAYADEAVILGAHYDHMGQAPDGIIWPGANDDASGVAALLEIARSWNEQGYIPKRSVIFAAWDAEELGLLGSIHYIENPPFPLENTVAMIQLDMIGVGSPILNIDGHSLLAEGIEHVADAMGIESKFIEGGGSDHVPFLSSGVPASAITWKALPDREINYHRPTDTVQVIDEIRMQSAAQIAELATLNLAESEPSIQEMLAARAKAAMEGDSEEFLSFSHPDQAQDDLYWFQDLQSLQPRRVSMEARNLLIAGNLASASVQIEVDALEPSRNITHTLTARIPVTFSYVPSGWLWNGTQQVWSEAETDNYERTVFKVGCPPGKEEGVSGAGRSAVEKYQRITELLGLSPEIQAKLLIVEDEEILWGSTALSQPRNQYASVRPGEVKLVYGEAISTSLQLQDSLVQLALAEASVNEGLASWLWQGLPLVLQGYDQSISTQTRFLPTLQEDLAQDSPTTDQASAWAATAYLQERLGWSALGRFIVKLGQMCHEACNAEEALDDTLLEFIGLDTAGFVSAWQSAWRSRLESAQAEINTLLSERVSAISKGDAQGLLRTIDRSVPNLEIEEIHWLENFQTNPPERYSMNGRLLAFLEDGGLLAEITMEYQPAGDDSTSASSTIHLTPSETGYYWAGPLVERLQGEWIDILHPSAKADLAAALLEPAERIYTEVASVLDIPQTNKVVIKLYEAPASYHGSISAAIPQTMAENAWTGPGESIKLNISEGGNSEDYSGTLANQISRSLLFSNGVKAFWLVEGISAYLSRPYNTESSILLTGLQTAELFEIANSGQMLELNDSVPTLQLSGEAYEIGRSASRDAVEFLVSDHGWPALVKILDAQERGTGLDNAFQASLGITKEQFEQDWVTSLLLKHFNSEWMAITEVFDPERAMKSVEYLSSPALGGRMAGSPGSIAAARYIAEAFLDYGLLPVGDLISETISLADHDELIPVNDPLSGKLPAYFQTFPISYTNQVSIPRLVILNERNDLAYWLRYRQDFRLVEGDGCTGTVSAPLVWGGNQAYPNIDLEGKIILRSTTGTLQAEIEATISHGAAALLLTSSRWKPQELFSKQPATQQQFTGAAIPVFEVSQPGYSRLLDTLGYDRQSIGRLPAFQSVIGSMRFECKPTRFETTQTANVLGLLPGSDPYLRQEVIVLGAHYDYVGDDVNHVRYSGANDDASGVAALLEIARIFHELDYQPKRSILFAAWGAQEPGQVGSNFYITNPIFPLRDTIAMIQLDGVGGGDGFYLGIQGYTEKDGELLFYLSAAEKALQEKIVYTSPFIRSDDTAFRQAGIPTVLISWRLANEDNLPDELANAVYPERVGIAGRVATLLLLALAR